MTRLRIATVGVGPDAESRSTRHIETIAKLHDMYELCAFCDRDPKRLKEAGAQFGVDALHTDLRQMLDNERPDVVYRLTPKDSIGPICLAILEAGSHLINEIPIGETLAMADALIDAAKRNNVKQEVAENVWCWPEELLKAAIARSGLMGELTHGRFQYPCGTYHGLSTIRKIFGCDPVRALGFDGEVNIVPMGYKAYTGPDPCKCKWEGGVFEFAGGQKVLYEMPAKGRPRKLHWEIEGTHGHLSGDTLVLYENGKEVEYPFQYEFDTVGDEQVIHRVYVDTDPRVEWVNPLIDYRIGSSAGPQMYGVSGKDEIARGIILAGMHKAVTEDTEPAYGQMNGRMDLEAWIAVRESAWRGGKWIDLPLTEETSVERAVREALTRRYGGDPVKDAKKLLGTTFPRGGVLWDVLGWL
jgi:predicted dehydrogenase